MATGPDGIYARVLRRTCIYIAETLSDIFNSLLQHTKVPKIWMDSYITPIHKPGKVKTQPASYRPIGVTCTIGRVFESRINKAINHHLETKSLIDDSQHGFRQGRSCETNLLVLMEYHAQRAEDGDIEDNCYFDLRAFFDGIPHQRCLAALHAHGVSQSGKIHRWVTAWLGAGGQVQELEARVQEQGQGGRRQNLRRQRVLLNGKASKWHDVTASIVQGSVLGPTLAKCFSNSSHQDRNLQEEDRPLVSKFADDEKRCRVVASEGQGQRMQEDINHMVSWCTRMGVLLNEDKVHILHVGHNNPKRPYTLGVGGPVIQEVEQEKDLGVLISRDLKPDKMIAKQTQKAHMKLSQFNSTFSYRGKTWLNMYKTYVKPSMLYGCEAWRPSSQQGIDKLEAVQKRAVRMAGGLGAGSYKEACRRAGLNTIQEDLEEADMVRVYRIMYGHDKIDKELFWKMEEARPGVGRRRFKEKEVRRTVATQRKAVRKTSFASRVQDPWNQLHCDVKKAKNPRAFRAEYRKAKHLA